MTRHKQQLLQEQENLLEQIQKQNSIETNSNPEDLNSEHPTKIHTEQQGSAGKIKRSPRNSPRKNSISKSVCDESPTDNATCSSGKVSLLRSSRGENTNAIRKTSLSSSSRNEISSPGSHEHSGHLMALLKDNSVTHDTTSSSVHAITDNNHNHQQHAGKYPQSSSRSRSPHETPLKRYLTSSSGHSDHVSKTLTNHRSGSSYSDYMEEAKVLDNSLFGRRMVSLKITIDRNIGRKKVVEKF